MRHSFLIFAILLLNMAVVGCKTKGNAQQKPYPAAVAPVKVENPTTYNTKELQDANIIGVWVLEKMQVGANEFSAQQIGKEISMQFLGNGTMIMKNGNNSMEFFTYTFKDNVIHTLEGTQMTVSELTENQLKIIAEEQGEKTILIYKRKKNV